MMSSVQFPYSREKIAAWLRGLLTVAWADGDFAPEEQELITSITQSQLAPKTDLGSLEPISPSELAAALGDDPVAAENFLRTAVMVALANGVYSLPEDRLLRGFCQALGQQPEALESLRHTLEDHPKSQSPKGRLASLNLAQLSARQQKDVLKPVRYWLDDFEVHDPRIARFLCKMIPAQCPFERDINLFGHKVVHIPPLCKLNPLYEQLVGLRFRALSYLADERGEDVSAYC